MTNNPTDESIDTYPIKSQNKPFCPYCDSDNVFGISRVVGYFSVIDNWNKSKKAEFTNRQKGKYWTD
ncbi:MAG: hypothetical protein FK734_12140 [Asgard group archaeon]|nr:hypothetical protein [Asgard group archaeon]